MRIRIAFLAFLTLVAALVATDPPASPAPATASPLSPSVPPGPDRLGLHNGEADASKLVPHSPTVQKVVAEANSIAGKFDSRGGSGAVSDVLEAAGLPPAPASTEEVRDWGKPGPGLRITGITLYLCENESGVTESRIVVAGRQFDEGPNGPGWRRKRTSTEGCTVRHLGGRST